MSDKPIYLTEQDVAIALDMQGAIAALHDVLLEQGRASAVNVPKAFHAWGGGNTMHTLGSVAPGRGYAGFKTWLRTAKGGGSIFSLFDADRGMLLALIQARTLGQLRTGAVTGLATKLLAPRDARRGALIGTGPQAYTQLEAIAAVHELDELRVFSPTAEKRRQFVEKTSALYPFKIVEAATIQDATHDAGLVTLITRAQEPFLTAADIPGCRHLNAVGAIVPGKAEFTQDVFDQTGLVVVDDAENARTGSRELREHFGTDAEKWNVSTLGGLLAQGKGRPREAGMTLFKGMGMGLSDLAVATAVYEYATKNALGHRLP